MVDAIISPLAERLTDFVLQQIREQVNLVRGVKEEVANLAYELKQVGMILDDAERRRFQDKSIKEWLHRLEGVCYEMDDVLDEWEYGLLKRQIKQSINVDPMTKCFGGCKKVSTHRHIAKKIKLVKEKLDKILREKERYNFKMFQPDEQVTSLGRIQTTAFLETKDVFGRDHEKDKILSKLTQADSSTKELGFQTISIVGSGGIGKTTLAQLIYNDSLVKDCYELRIWICVSDPFDQKAIAKGILEDVTGSFPQPDQLNVLLKHLTDSIQGKKFLLVLDDVWTRDYALWEPLKVCLNSGAAGSKVLVTTRNKEVAKMMGTSENEIHQLGVLSDDECWSLLSHLALVDKSEIEHGMFEEVGKQIAQKCKGLPLAAKTMGGLLRFKHRLDEWENVLQNDIWKLEEARIEIFPHLLLSYNELSPPLKRCFSYCAIFPKDSDILVESLIRQWGALGYLDSDGGTSDWKIKGREYFDKLAMRSLFQDFFMSNEPNEAVIVMCRMHDIVHDFAQFLRKKEMSNIKLGITCKVCNPALISYVQEYRSLELHGYKMKTLPCICDCLVSMRSFAYTYMEGIPKRVEKLIHLRYLDLGSNERVTTKDVKIICGLYNLKVLLLGGCNFPELPWEIGNLIRLRELDLSRNEELEDLPYSICNLRELRTLDLEACTRLSKLPEEIHRLENLKHLINGRLHTMEISPSESLMGKLPDNLQTLSLFKGKLSYLQKLNRLRGWLKVMIPEISGEVDVIEAKGAELNKKVNLHTLDLWFPKEDGNAEDGVKMGVLDALNPHPNLAHLTIGSYGGSKLTDWIASPLYQLTKIRLYYHRNLLSLPALGILPCLELLELREVHGLELVGREFLGILEEKAGLASSSSSSTKTAFPMLKELLFDKLSEWREWEDITAEEKDCSSLSFFPRLDKLFIFYCNNLRALPHRLLRKAAALGKIAVYDSPHIQQYSFNIADDLDIFTTKDEDEICKSNMGNVKEEEYLIDIVVNNI